MTTPRTAPSRSASTGSSPIPTLSSGATAHDVVSAVEEVGAAIVADLVDRELLGRLLRDLAPWIGATPPGSRSNDPEWELFHGHRTVRVNGIVAKSDAFVDVALHPTVLGFAEQRLIPDGGQIQINDTQAIAIGPGEESQYLHRDQSAWPWFNQLLPDGPEITLIAMVALSDFTEDNGATRVVPYSHLEADRPELFDPDRAVPAEMRAGSVLFFSGKTIHGGGPNHTSDEVRSALHLSYLLGWLRPEEAHPLAIPTPAAAALPPKARALLGFAKYDPAPQEGGRLWLVDFEDPAQLFDLDPHTNEHHVTTT